MVGFKKKVVSAERVAAVENAAASAPIVGDPRIGAPPAAIPNPPPVVAVRRQETTEVTHLGSSQELEATRRYEEGKVYDVPVGQIQSNPFGPRAIYTSTAVDDMAVRMSTSGQRISATGFINDQGDVVLIEGETRLRGARAGGLPTLRIEIRPRPPTDRALYEEARAANVERNEQSPLDDAIKWRELLAKKVYPTQSALAKALNLGEDFVSRTISLSGMPSRLLHTCAEHPDLCTLKMLNAIREFWEVKGDDSTLELIFEAAKTGMGYRDVAARRKAAEKGPIKRPRSTREAVVFQGAKGEFKSFEEGRIELAFKGLTPKGVEEITAKIMALFPKE